MTTPRVPPTLVELLEEAAKTCDFSALRHRVKTGQNDAGRVLDGAMEIVFATRAARLRAAAARLREEMEYQAKEAPTNIYAEAASCVLERINGGSCAADRCYPGHASPPVEQRPACGTCGGDGRAPACRFCGEENFGRPCRVAGDGLHSQPPCPTCTGRPPPPPPSPTGAK